MKQKKLEKFKPLAMALVLALAAMAFVASGGMAFAGECNDKCTEKYEECTAKCTDDACNDTCVRRQVNCAHKCGS